jgi:hypothetical protein
MSPLETWLLLALVFAILYAAFVGGGRIIDWILDRLWGPSRRDLDGVYRRERALGIMESWTPKDKE